MASDPASPGMIPLTIYPSRRKLGLAAVGALAFVGAGFFIVSDRTVPFFIKIVGGYGGIAFFGLCLPFCLYRLIRPKPMIVVSRDGLFDNASAIGAGWLRWHEIAEIKILSFMSQRFLGIVPVNLESVLARTSFWRRLFLRMNRQLVHAPINIPESVLPMSVDELLEKINEYRPG